MQRAIQKAKETYNKYGNDLEFITDELGLLVIEEPLKGRLKEVYFGDSIVVRRDLPKTEKRDLIAHAIGHHLMHAGNHWSQQKRVYSFGNYHERQANVFAVFLLVPEILFENHIKNKSAVHEIAAAFDIPENTAKLRMKLYASLQLSAETAVL